MNKWPFLTKLFEQNKLAYIDLALADQLVKTDEAEACLICTLSKAVRLGHTCLSVTDTPFEQIWEECSSKEIRKMEKLFTQGCKSTLTPPLVQRDHLLYFEKYFAMESALKTELRRHLQAEPTLKIDTDLLEKKVASLLQKKMVLQEQAEAIKKALQSNLTLICGGPGTGKTYTAGWILKVLFALHKGAKVALMAPTGKAAANLQKALPELSAKTVHAYLMEKSVEYDVVLVDESSMIDLKLMLALLQSVKPGTCLLMLGDPYQLPPVEVGGVFSDFVKRFPAHLARLKTCMRTDLKEIVQLAEAVKKGKTDSVLHHLREQNQWEESFTHIIDHCLPYLPLKEEQNLQDVLKSFNRYRLLSPMRKGPFGVERLNQTLHKKAKELGCPYTPILIVKNDHSLQLYNGEVGLLVKGEYAVFPDPVHGMRTIKSYLLPKYELAYCLSVHKSQGSEFDHVWLVLPDGSERFGREVLYTAITRARRSLRLFGERQTVVSTVENHFCRMSGV